ncbi:divergent polysaccharide deacetylase family protein [Helicobacter pullorum]|uniref:divergent polysaccharide deacetylase family protein n=1 Tax=Helicobacter pullorum TaxID=35818 RepID=UPI0006CCCC91|nr:divergent polysaccharide deacetylase family protein [Helicobacter pullorum]KPH52127.1 hypothetical protein HPU229254_03560 [Helicobacter pullorum]
MDKINPITIGIIALLLLLLTFNFIPKSDSKPQQSLNYKESIPIDTNTSKVNVALLQKNIKLLEENLKTLQQENNQTSQSTIPQITPPPISQESKPTKPTQIPSKPKPQCQKPRPQLAIIIDDISNFYQYQKIQEIPYKITPSLFPRSIASQNTPEIAKKSDFYMVHLPLEALNFSQKEHKYLLSTDSKQTIQETIQNLKKDFPNLTYLNNHTGSKFTQTPQAMYFLLEILNENNISFVDSRTTPHTKTRNYYQQNLTTPLNQCQNQPFLERDIFLDNELDITKITQNLIQAVKIAKTKGYAIAIGHPHQQTILALKNATNYLQNSGVELVYINELVIP